MVGFFCQRVYHALVACPSKVERASAIGTRKTRTLPAAARLRLDNRVDSGADHRAINSDEIVTNEPGPRRILPGRARDGLRSSRNVTRGNWFAYVGVRRRSKGRAGRKNDAVRNGKGRSCHIPDFPVYLDVTKRGRVSRRGGRGTDTSGRKRRRGYAARAYVLAVTFRDTRFELNDARPRAISPAVAAPRASVNGHGGDLAADRLVLQASSPLARRLRSEPS